MLQIDPSDGRIIGTTIAAQSQIAHDTIKNVGELLLAALKALVASKN